MNIYDTANKLASEIRESEEYLNYKKRKTEMLSNAETKTKIDEFEKLRYEVQIKEMQGIKAEEEKNQKLQEMYVMLVQNKEIKEYFDWEIKFNVMIADVNKIIAEAIKDVL